MIITPRHEERVIVKTRSTRFAREGLNHVQAGVIAPNLADENNVVLCGNNNT